MRYHLTLVRMAIIKKSTSIKYWRSSHCDSVEMKLTSTRKDPWPLTELRIWHLHELWCRSQSQVGSHVAVSVLQAGSCSSDLTPAGNFHMPQVQP